MKTVIGLIAVFACMLVVSGEEDNAQEKDPYLYNEESFKEKVAASPHFIMFYAPWCGHCQRLKPVWAELCDEINSDDDLGITVAKVDCTSETKLCSDEGVLGYPTLKLYHPDREAYRHVGGRDLASLRKFAMAAVQPPPAASPSPKHEDGLFDLTAESFDKHIEKGMHFIKFYAPWCSHCKRLEPTWAQLAKAHIPGEDKKDVAISRVDCTAHRSVCSSHGVSGYPTLLWFEDGKMIKKYQSGRDLVSFEKFIASMKNEPKVATEVPQEEVIAPPQVDEVAPVVEQVEQQENAKTVFELDEKNFEYHTAVDVTFIKFYAPWCGFCKRLIPIWEKLAEADFPEDLNVKIAKVDCTDNSALCSKFEVKGYPTLLLFKDGRQLAKYSGSRTLDDLKAFVLTASVTDSEKQKDEL